MSVEECPLIRLQLSHRGSPSLCIGIQSCTGATQRIDQPQVRHLPSTSQQLQIVHFRYHLCIFPYDVEVDVKHILTALLTARC